MLFLVPYFWSSLWSYEKESETEIVVEVKTSEFIKKLRKAIIEFCDGIGKIAQAAFDDTNKAFAAAQRKVDLAKGKVTSWQGDVTAWQDRLRMRQAELNKRKKEMQTDCRQKCPKVCFGFFNWNSRCWKFWGLWVGCLYWDSCFRMIDDIFCLAGCEINKLWKKFLVWVEQIGLKIALALGDIAKGLLTMVQGILDLAKGVIEFGKKLKDFVGEVVQGAIEALKWIADKALDIFELRNLTLTAKMDSDFNACVGYAINVTIFTKKVEGSGEACLNLGFIKSLVGRVTDGDGSPPELKGITKTEKNLEEAESKKMALDDAERKLESAEEDARKEVGDETAKTYDEEMRRKRGTIPSPDTIAYINKLPKRIKVPTKEEMQYIRAANEPLPDHNARKEEIISAFQSHPWFNSQEITLLGTSLPLKDDTVPGSKRTILDFESSMNPCERMKRAIQNYEGLTDGLITSAESLTQQKNMLSNTVREERSKIDRIKTNIQDLERHQNLTEEERADAYFWYNKLNQGLTDFTKRSEEAMNKQDSYAVSVLRNQLNHMLKTEKGSTVLEFTDLIHQNAMKGYKRSLIPKHESDDGEKTLQYIKMDLKDVLTNTDVPLTNQAGRLSVLRNNIQSMKKYAKTCENK